METAYHVVNQTIKPSSKVIITSNIRFASDLTLADPVLQPFKIVDTDTILGSPVGFHLDASPIVSNTIQVMEKYAAFFGPRNQSQVYFTGLRLLFASKLTHLARTTVTSFTSFDSAILAHVCKALNIDPTDEMRVLQLKLPINHGGFGFSSLEDTAIFQLVGGHTRALFHAEQVPGTATLPSLSLALQEMFMKLGPLDPSNRDEKQLNDLISKLLLCNNAGTINPNDLEAFLSIQHLALKVYHSKSWRTWVAQGDQTDPGLVERIHSISSAPSGRFLSVNPNTAETRLSEPAFLIACKRRLGIPCFPDAAICAADNAPVSEEHPFR